MPKDCELCQIAKDLLPVNKIYLRDSKIKIVKCLRCGEPLVLSILHRKEFEDEDMEYIYFMQGEKFQKRQLSQGRCYPGVDHAHFHFV